MANIKIPDSASILIGAGPSSNGDLRLTHDATNSSIANATGTFTINNIANASMILGTNDTTAVTISNGQNTTFAGTVTSGAASSVGIDTVQADVNSTEVGPGYINLARDDTTSAKQIQFTKNNAVHSYLETSNAGFNIRDVSGTVKITLGSAGDSAVSWGRDTNGVYQSVGSNQHLRFLFDDGSTEAMRIIDGGNVGIGTAVPITTMQVGDFTFTGGDLPSIGSTQTVNINSSGATTAADTGYQLSLTETSALGVNKGGGISFQAVYDGSDNVATVAGIKGQRENNTANNLAGYLSFLTRGSSGSCTERMRLTSASNITMRGAAEHVTGLTINGGICPNADDSNDFGLSDKRWDDIYATNGTIQTSDERKKTSISDSSLGLSFLNQLRPVEYKWKDYTDDTVEVHEKKSPIEHKFTRKHFGLIAQEVKTVLDNNSIDTKDFAGYVHDSDADQYGIRYTEFVGVLIKAVQELSAKVTALENA